MKGWIKKYKRELETRLKINDHIILDLIAEIEQYDTVVEVAENLLQAIQWECDNEPEIIEIPSQIQVKCMQLKQALAKLKEKE